MIPIWADPRAQSQVPQQEKIPADRQQYRQPGSKTAHHGQYSTVTNGEQLLRSGLRPGALGGLCRPWQEEIPAIVVNVSTEDCFLMSLVENLARRQHMSIELVQQIGVLKERGYTSAQIARQNRCDQGICAGNCSFVGMRRRTADQRR